MMKKQETDQPYSEKTTKCSFWAICWVFSRKDREQVQRFYETLLKIGGEADERGEC